MKKLILKCFLFFVFIFSIIMFGINIDSNQNTALALSGNELMIYTGGVHAEFVYEQLEIGGRKGVYRYTPSTSGSTEWANRLEAKETSTAYWGTAEAARANIISQGYEYLLLDFYMTGGTMKVLYPSPTGHIENIIMEGTFENNDNIMLFANGYKTSIISYEKWFTMAIKIDGWIGFPYVAQSLAITGNGYNIYWYFDNIRYFNNNSFINNFSQYFDSYNYGADEMAYAKGTVTYTEQIEEVYGRTGVYRAAINGWNGQIDAKHTSHLGDGLYDTPMEARNSLISNGYRYVAVTLALDEGSQVGCYTTLPFLSGMSGDLGGIILQDGSTFTYNVNLLQYNSIVESTPIDRIAVYANNEKVASSDIIRAGVWYTVVCRLQLDVALAKDGENSYVNVGLTNASGYFYVSNVNYFYEFNNDFVYEADEMAYAKGTVTYTEQTNTIYGKKGVYKATINGWNGQIDAKHTSHLGDGLYETPMAARIALINEGYRYVAITLALDDNSRVGCYTTLPYLSGMSGDLGGVILQTGNSISYNANLLAYDTFADQSQKGRIKVYSYGYEIGLNDIIQSGVWYTIVCQLQLDVTLAKDGENSYVNVGLTNASGYFYVSDVKYYRESKSQEQIPEEEFEIEQTLSVEEPIINLTPYTTYYFDAQNGNDNNNGTIDFPKCSLGEIENIAYSASESNPVRIMLKKGTTFTGNLVLSGYQTTENKPLIIDSYGSGDDYPKIIGWGSDTSINAVIRILNDNIRIYNLEITGPTAYQGIYVVPSKGGAFKNVVIKGCFVHDVNFIWNYLDLPENTDPSQIDVEEVCTQYKSDKTPYGRYVYRKYAGISFNNEYPASPTWFQNIFILDNRVENIGKIGINIYNMWNNQPGVGYGYNKYAGDELENNVPSLKVGRYPHINVVCKGNFTQCTGGDGIVVSGVENGLVESNTCYKANYLGRTGYWNAGIWVYASRDIFFQYNEAAYTYLGGGDGQGFDIDNACSNIYFQYNYSHHNQGGGMLVCNLITTIDVYDSNGSLIETITSKGKWENNFIRNNLFVNNGMINIPTRSAFITIARQVNDLYVYNNTVIMRDDINNQSVINTEDHNPTSIGYRHYYYNNIIYSPSNNNADFTISMIRDYRFDNNLFYNINFSGLSKASCKNLIIGLNPQFNIVSNYDGYDKVSLFYLNNSYIFILGRLFEGNERLKYDIMNNRTTGINYLGALAA